MIALASDTRVWLAAGTGWPRARAMTDMRKGFDFAKRLERGRFTWPQAQSGRIHLTVAQLSMLLEGIDWRNPQRTWRPQHAA